eukprot:CAMPEP_0119155338 /NCGR_PEP_ID=MMETSP1310-20130426/51694_1 /TAXON_ID=464262 /ORGANISM="Genus nov. species nov., Strain RCC2339" /LENGTH=434 /DNA_ID=CAMNT_0007147933 /DNA_START=34 /DNA_END=1339 /DNA_ORIENTATION=-
MSATVGKREREETAGGTAGQARKRSRVGGVRAKVVILVGGHSKGTRFRPLSFDVPKPLVPIAGLPLLQHYLNECSCAFRASEVELAEVLLLGFFQAEEFDSFCNDASQRMGVPVRYLKEPSSLGTAGSLYHFRDEIMSGLGGGGGDRLFVLHGDIMCKFPFAPMLAEFAKHDSAVGVILGHKVPHSEVPSYGCLVSDPHSNELLHYVEKPSGTTPLSNTINCGVYLLNPIRFFDFVEHVATHMEEDDSSVTLSSSYSIPKNHIQMETAVLPRLAGEQKIYVLPYEEWWLQIKKPSECIAAAEMIMSHCRDQMSDSPPFPVDFHSGYFGNVVVHPMAQVDPSAKIGPNVSIGANAIVGKGVRISNSIILDGTVLRDRCLVTHSILCWNVDVGSWARIEGTEEHSHTMEGVCVLGKGVQIAPEIIAAVVWFSLIKA